jgi:hypothetical protein
MVHQIRIALLALPSACMEMNNPQSTLPEKRWDMQSINHLMDSTTKLIQHSVTTKITPTIERFAQATIEKIDSDVIPALGEEHQVTVDLLDQEYSRFQDILSNISSMRSEIASKDEACSSYSSEHEHCREEEHTIVTEVTECEEQHKTCTNDWTTCEEHLTIIEGDIETLWCEEAFDSLSKDFYHSSKVTMTKYIERKQKCATTRNECEEHAPICVTKVENRTETRERCDTEQVHLEQCTCERANIVEHLTEDFTLQWNELTSAYEDLIKESEDLEGQKIKEFEGLHVVKCLLEKIVVIGQTDGPCNESHVEQVTQEVAECHITSHLNTTHLVLHPKPSPVFPPLYEHNPYPCGSDFIAQYYSHLPEDAGAKECDSHYCSTRLVQHVEPVVVQR